MDYIVADGTPCDDGDAGTRNDSCSNGSCSGAPLTCTTSADCDDDNVCNGDEWCNTSVGACLPGTGLSCPDPGQCQYASCDAVFGCVTHNVANGALCNDGDSGTRNDHCARNWSAAKRS